MTQTKEQKEALAAAQAAAPDEEALRDIAARVPPLVRDEEHSFVPVEDTDRPEGEEVTEPSNKATTLTITREDNAGSTYERSTAFSETDLERLTDEQIKDAGVLSRATPRIPASHLAPSSERPRQPGAKAPAAAAGSWPVHEGQMPAVLPTDPPVEEETTATSTAFADVSGFKETEDGTLARKGLEIGKSEVAHAAALWLRLRQQFPAFTREQLADEFEIQWLSGRAGAEQSHRAGEELSQHGLTEAGDDRVEPVMLGEARAEASKASPAPTSQPPAAIPEAGLPSQNEPASTAVDAEKKASTDVAKVDAAAIKEAAKLEKQEPAS